ncbi:MAG: restriction endonuclease subunit S [Candidatus Pacebacteria bacterium]|nr:restriction endonuclease subunit S [Candidatus Paceibacterota bacterium]
MNSWQLKKLGEVCDLVTRGVSPKYILEGGVVVLNQKCIRDHKLNYLEAKRHDDKKNFSKEKFLQIGDILVNSTGVGTLGRVAQVRSINQPTIVDSHITIVRPTKGIFDTSYFRYVMFFIEESIKEMGTGSSGQTELSRDTLKSIEIRYPKSLSEQKRIVKILDEKIGEIKEAIKLREEAIIDTEKILSRTLSEIFEEGKNKGWEEKELQEVVEITSSKRIYKSDYISKGVPFYRTKEISELDDGREIKTELFISEEKFTEIKNKFGEPQTGDLLLTAIGTIGKMYVVQKEHRFYFKDGNILWLKNFKGISSDFLKFLLRFEIQRMQNLSAGSAYKALPIIKLKKLKITIPSLHEQQKIVEKFDSLSKKIKQLKELKTSQLFDLKRLEKSLLREAFNGEL